MLMNLFKALAWVVIGVISLFLILGFGMGVLSIIDPHLDPLERLIITAGSYALLGVLASAVWFVSRESN